MPHTVNFSDPLQMLCKSPRVDLDTVRLLLSRGAEVNTSDVHSMTPLMHLVTNSESDDNFWDVFDVLNTSGGEEVKLDIR